jgi:hypothetical protein
VNFYGDDLIAVQNDDGTIYTLFARLCENLGLRREAQVRRVQRHSVLREGLITLTKTQTVSFEHVNAITGPIVIAGAQPGDVLQVEILDLKPGVGLDRCLPRVWTAQR